MRALCEIGVLIFILHLKFHFILYTWQYYIFYTVLFTLHSSYFILHIFHTLHCTLYNPHFTLYSSDSKYYTLQFTLYTLHFTLHSSCPILYTAPFILSELFSSYLNSTYLILSLLICYLNFHKLFPTIIIKEHVCVVR